MDRYSIARGAGGQTISQKVRVESSNMIPPPPATPFIKSSSEGPFAFTRSEYVRGERTRVNVPYNIKDTFDSHMEELLNIAVMHGRRGFSLVRIIQDQGRGSIIEFERPGINVPIPKDLHYPYDIESFI
jgi:hypothetical protein